MTRLGFLLPESVLFSTWFAVLSAFVAINTVMYVTLATMKCLPVIRPQEWFRRRYARGATRSIYPGEREASGPSLRRPQGPSRPSAQ